MLREDIRDLEPVRNIQLLGLFLGQPASQVGGPVVLSNLASDIEISPNTAKSWIEILERMYIVFVVRPFTKSLPRAVLKPPKIYFFDNGDVIGDDGARFENLVAASLLKRLHFLEDRDGYNCELRYIRDKEGREVDFAIVKEGAIEELIEAKLTEDEISPSLLYYTRRLRPKKSTQIVAKLRRTYDRDGITITDPSTYFDRFFLK